MLRGMDHAVCAHCGVAILHEDTMETRGDRAFCCSNFAAMADSMPEQAAGPAQRGRASR